METLKAIFLNGEDIFDAWLALTAVILLLVLAGFVYLNHRAEEPKEFSCINNISYEIKNNKEYHIQLKKGRPVACSIPPNDILN